MRSVLKHAFIIAAIATMAMAADKPDFSGDWKINLAKSNFGVVPPPTSFTRKIAHSEPSLTIADDQKGGTGDQNDTRSYTTDGKEIAYESNGAGVKSAATWDGEAIVFNSKATAGGLELVFKDRMTLSDGGKTLRNVVRVETPQGEFEITLVFDRQ